MLASNQRNVYVGAVLLNAVTFLITAALTLAVPSVRPPASHARPSGTLALRDTPFLALMATTAILALCWALLSSGLPLWASENTAAPAWASAAAVVVSSAGIAAFQLPVTRQTERLRGAVRAITVSGIALSTCCLLFAAAPWTPSPLWALAILFAGVIAHVIGELYYMASRWGLSLRLMRKDAAGQYQGVVATTEAAVQAIGPAVVTLLVTGWHQIGWAVLAALFLAACVPTARLARTSLRTRSSTALMSDHGPPVARI